MTRFLPGFYLVFKKKKHMASPQAHWEVGKRIWLAHTVNKVRTATDDRFHVGIGEVRTPPTPVGTWSGQIGAFECEKVEQGSKILVFLAYVTFTTHRGCEKYSEPQKLRPHT